MTANEITTKIGGGKIWQGGNSERVYVEELLKTPYDVQAVFVDVSGQARLGIHDYAEETNSGRVVVVCNNRLSRPKRSSLQDAIWALLD